MTEWKWGEFPESKKSEAKIAGEPLSSDVHKVPHCHTCTEETLMLIVDVLGLVPMAKGEAERGGGHLFGRVGRERREGPGTDESVHRCETRERHLVS